MNVLIALLGGGGLRGLGDVVPAVQPPLVQLVHHRFDLQIVLVALAGLQGRDQLFHLGKSLLVVDGQEHPGLDIHQMGGHSHKLTGDFQVQLPAAVHPLQVLFQNQGDLDVLNLHLVFTEQVEDQVQRAGKILQIFRLRLDHVLQMVDRTVQTLTSFQKK